MIYFWEASKAGEKVGEKYIMTIAGHDDMKLVYNDKFNVESVRKVLSAISNREMLSGNEEERKFWNNNMWMMDDLDYMKLMIDPVKHLNSSELTKDINLEKDVELIFLPLHGQTKIINGNKIILNFFKVRVDFLDYDKVSYDGKDFIEYIKDAIQEV
jgi:hypothetical protein